VITRGSLALDPVRREVTVLGHPVNLTTTEYNILELLMRRSPAVVDRKAIAEHGWRDETDALGSNAIDVQLSRLRAKLPSAGVRIAGPLRIPVRAVGLSHQTIVTVTASRCKPVHGSAAAGSGSGPAPSLLRVCCTGIGLAKIGTEACAQPVRA